MSPEEVISTIVIVAVLAWTAFIVMAPPRRADRAKDRHEHDGAAGGRA